MLLVFLIALGALIAFVKESWSADSTAVLVLVALVGLGLLTAREAFQAFGNEALVTVAAMFVLSAGLTRTGAVEKAGKAIVRLGGDREPRVILALMVTCCAASAFVNNTPIAVVFLPIVLGIAERTGIPGSRLLIPMSYATIIGGMCTVIGTSTNVLVAGELGKHGLPALAFFEPLPLALVGMVMTIAYMTLVGRRLLPRNATVTSATDAGKISNYVTELTVPKESPLAGKTLSEAIYAKAPTLRIFQIIRGEEILQPRSPRLVLREGDTLIVRGNVNELVQLHRHDGVDVGQAATATLTSRERDTTLAELLVRPGSGAIGARVGDLALHARHHVAVLAVQREGTHIRTSVVDLRLRLGDVLLVQGDAEGLESFRGSTDLVLLEGVAEKVVLRDRAALALGVIVVVVVTAAFGLMPISILALAGALAMVAMGCLTSREAYRAVDLPLLVLMGGMIALGMALESTGGAAFLADHLLRAARPFGDVGALAAVYLACNLLTALVSNAAAALLTLPIAVAVAQTTGMNVQPFVIAVLFAASIDFSTPIGYQTNTFVYGPGGYRFMDYVRVGVPLNLLWWLLATLLIPVWWPLRG
jgi:di/tricarboxylate transporter